MDWMFSVVSILRYRPHTVHSQVGYGVDESFVAETPPRVSACGSDEGRPAEPMLGNGHSRGAVLKRFARRTRNSLIASVANKRGGSAGGRA
jgi:hypothetical protein